MAAGRRAERRDLTYIFDSSDQSSYVRSAMKVFAETRAGFRVPQNNYRAFFIPVNESFEPLFFYSSL